MEPNCRLIRNLETSNKFWACTGTNRGFFGTGKWFIVQVLDMNFGRRKPDRIESAKSMPSFSTLLPLMFATKLEASSVNFSRRSLVLNCEDCTRQEGRDSIEFPHLLGTAVRDYFTNLFSALSNTKQLCKWATSNLFDYANRRIDHLAKRMLVFAVERIDMSRPVQLSPGRSLTSVAVPAQETGLGRVRRNSFTEATDFGMSNSSRLPELVFNNC